MILNLLGWKKCKTKNRWSSSLWFQTWTPNHKNLAQKFKMTMRHHHHYCNLHKKHYNAIFIKKILLLLYMKMMTMEMGLDCWEWEAHESSQLWWWWCLKLAIIVAKLLLLHKNTRTPYAFPTWRCQKIQRCHVLGYGGPLKFFKFGWLLGSALATKLYTHRGVTLLNCKDTFLHTFLQTLKYTCPFWFNPQRSYQWTNETI
jgi:hypothetical protein